MAYLGQHNVYENTVPDKRMVSDRILNVNPLKIATLSMLGMNVGKFNMVNRDNYTYEWLNDTYVPESTTINGTSLAASTTNTTLTPTNLTLFQPGDLILAGDELLWVSSVSSGIPTFTRGYGSTTATNHANASTIYLVGRARIDGDAADDSPQTEVTSSYNYTQILQRTINISRSRQKVAAYGIVSPVDYDIDKKMDELSMLLNKLPYYGKRYVGTSAAARTAGGFRTFITNNSTNVASAALTRDHIDSLLSDIHADGGDPDLILCGAHTQRKINSFYEGFITTERSESLGGNKITQLMNPITGGIMDVVVDRDCPADEMWVLEKDLVSFYPFDPFFYEDLGKTGDAILGQIVGEYGFICQGDAHHGFLYGISTSS